MALATPIVSSVDKHMPITGGDKLPAGIIISAQAGNQAIAGSDGAVYVPAYVPGVLASMQINAATYTFTTETGWIFRNNPTAAVFTLAAPASMPLATELRFINSSSGTITLAGGLALSRAGTTLSTIAPFGTLWLYRDNQNNWRQTN